MAKEKKTQRKFDSGVEKVAVELELQPGYSVKALLPKSGKTLGDVQQEIKDPDAFRSRGMPQSHLTHAERIARIKAIGEDIKR